MIKISDPTITTLLQNFKREIKRDINCCTIGRVVNVNLEKKTADVEIAYRPTGYGKSAIWNAEAIDEEEVFYPTLLDCPIIGNSFAPPLDKYLNDNLNCLVFFCDRDIDRWFSYDGTSTPRTRRMHDLSDGFVLLGIDNIPNNMFKAPDWYFVDFNTRFRGQEALVCPFKHYEYEPYVARLKYECGEVNVGYTGVTLCSRDCMDIWAYAEGGSIRFYPTEGFHVNNSVGQIDLWGRYDINGEHEDIDGKISIGNTKLTKPDSSDPEADPFITSDIYRILKQMKAVINKLADKILLLPTALVADYGSCTTTAIWASETALMLETELLEFKARVEALFEPIDGKDIHEGTDEEN